MNNFNAKIPGLEVSMFAFSLVQQPMYGKLIEGNKWSKCMFRDAHES